MEKMTKKIETLEAQNLAEKEWTLIGEASSKQRPVGSLLEVDLEFENMSKNPTVVLTEETNLQLEDIIKKRILDELFDDVVRKVEKGF